MFHGTIFSAMCTRNLSAADVSTSFPGSLFSASLVVMTTREAERRDPGNEVADMLHETIFSAKAAANMALGRRCAKH